MREILGIKPNIHYIVLAIVALGICIKVLLSIVFWLTHQKPLTPDQVSALSRARRIHYINNHYKLLPTGFSVNPKFRESLEKTGRWDRISVAYPLIGSFVSELLRYKRHEWFVWILSDENEAKFIWANKGDDNSRCYSKANIMQLLLIASENECKTVMAFHNHPHTKERYWNLLSPSETDLKSYNTLKDVFTKAGMNFIDGLVSQGRFIIYGFEFSDTYSPPGSEEALISKENGVNKRMNYKLHKEFKKIKHERISSKLFS